MIDHLKEAHGSPAWQRALAERPSPLAFLYRSSQSAMMGRQFHHDLLTPGIVTEDDPAPIEAGMRQVTLDHQGFLTMFEAIPPQVEHEPPPTASVDWTAALTLAGLDIATLQPVQPQWNWLASVDTRAAWTGNWPGSKLPLRVEAGSLHGKIVAFRAMGPWTKPGREPQPTSGQETASALLLFVLALAIVGGGIALARKHAREGRGDNDGALSLARAIVAALWLLWICQVHASPSIGLLGIFLLCLATTTFYGVLIWSIYLALEPFVRRYWPQTLVSWTTLLRHRAGDPVVGRDMLVGVALGTSVALFILVMGVFGLTDAESLPTTSLLGVRSTAGGIMATAVYAVRSALFVFFLLFLLRGLVRRNWAAGVAFALIFATLSGLGSRHPIADFSASAVYSGILALAVMRWGLTTLAVGLLSANLLLSTPATSRPSAWYIGSTMIMLAIPLAMAARGCYTAARRAPGSGASGAGSKDPDFSGRCSPGSTDRSRLLHKRSSTASSRLPDPEYFAYAGVRAQRARAIREVPVRGERARLDAIGRKRPSPPSRRSPRAHRSCRSPARRRSGSSPGSRRAAPTPRSPRRRRCSRPGARSTRSTRAAEKMGSAAP